MSCHPQSESLPVGGDQVVKNQTINRAANKEKEVRAKTIKKHKHFHLKEN